MTAKAQDEDFQRSCREMVRRIEDEAARGAEANVALSELLLVREKTIAELEQSQRGLAEQLEQARTSERLHRERADRAEATNEARNDLLRAVRACFPESASRLNGKAFTPPEPQTWTNEGAAKANGDQRFSLSSDDPFVGLQGALDRFSTDGEAWTKEVLVSIAELGRAARRPADNSALRLDDAMESSLLAPDPVHLSGDTPLRAEAKANLPRPEVVDPVSDDKNEQPGSTAGSGNTREDEAPDGSHHGATDAPTSCDNQAAGMTPPEKSIALNRERVPEGRHGEDQAIAPPAIAASTSDLVPERSVATPERSKPRLPSFLSRDVAGAAVKEAAKELAWDDPYGDRD